MLIPEYKRDMNQNYLILSGKENPELDSYQGRMLFTHAVPGLLKCHLQNEDAEARIYYDITSRCPLSELFEERQLRCDDLRLVFSGFISVMESMHEYLMQASSLILEPEYIFTDGSRQTLEFCFLPGYGRDIRQQFQNLTEYLLPRLDHRDTAGVMLGYGIYRRALEETFHLEHIKEELYKPRDADPVEYPSNEGAPDPAKPQEGGRIRMQMQDFSGASESEDRAKRFSGEREIGQDRENRKKRDRESRKERSGEGWKEGGRENRTESDRKSEGTQMPPWMPDQDCSEKADTGKNRRTLLLKILTGCCFAVLLLAVVLLKQLGYIPGVSTEMLLGIVTVGLAVMILIMYIRKKKSEAGPKENCVREPELSGSVMINRPPTRTRYQIREEAVPSDRLPYPEAEERFRPESGKKSFQKAFQTQRTDCQETVVLTAANLKSPAALISREPGELPTIYLEHELTVIGKLENAADAVIDDPTVSRIHAKIRKQEDEYYLSDLNSRNGTTVNGHLLSGNEQWCLSSQDEVDFASARYVFVK